MPDAPLHVSFKEKLGTAGNTVQIIFEPTIENGTAPYQYLWDFVDENTKSKETTPIHTYLLSKSEKMVLVTLQVTDKNNKQATATNHILLPSIPPPFGLDKDAIRSLKITSAMTAITIALLSVFMTIYPNLIGVTLTAGALGGFLHEYAQSKGTIFFIEKRKDGLYLGSVTGLILGIIAGLFVLKANMAIGTGDMVPIFLESILAGLAFKGISEAATGSIEVEDDFEITSANHTSGKINIQIRNNMLHELELQQVIITDSKSIMHAESVPSQVKKVPPKQIIGFDVSAEGLTGPTIKVTIIARNSTKEIQSIPL